MGRFDGQIASITGGPGEIGFGATARFAEKARRAQRNGEIPVSTTASGVPGQEWRKMLRRRVAVLAGIVAGATSLLAPPPQATATSPAVASSSPQLPAPFSEWNVQLSPAESDQQVLRLTFDSPRLGRMVVNTVYLPDSYKPVGPRLPVVYALHGTTLPALDNVTTCPATAAVESLTFLQEIACGGGSFQDRLFDIPSQLHAMRFLVVSPDTDPAGSICQTCSWIDGREDLLPNVYPATARTVAADSFLHKELYPLIEALFNVRTDRGGRGVIGFSMGGTAAYVQAMMHPDVYAYVGSVSGPYDLDDPAVAAVWTAFGYLRDQGYGTAVTDPVWWRQFNPKAMITNLTGSDIEVLASSGDGCASLASLLSSPLCQGRFSPLAGIGGQAEMLARHSHRAAVRDFATHDLPLVAVMTPGLHGANNATVFADAVVPGANDQFGSAVEDPATFTFRSAVRHFTIWGYDVTSVKPTDGFVELRHATSDGRHVTVSGSGTVHITTPPSFEPGKAYAVQWTDSAEGPTSTVADASGRLRLVVALGRDPVSITISG